MADDNAKEPEGEVGTPEGFARFKASSLDLSPLEVLICFEHLSKIDQGRVMRTITQRSDFASGRAKVASELEDLKKKLTAMDRQEAASMKQLETRTSDDKPVPTQQGKVGVGKFPQGQYSYLGKPLSQHDIDAVKYAMSTGVIPQSLVQGSLNKADVEAILKAQADVARMEAMKQQSLQYDLEAKTKEEQERLLRDLLG